MKIKDGVSIRGMRSEILFAVQVADRVWARYNAEAVITSGTESSGGHKRGSAHWRGDGVDLRAKNLAVGHRQRAAEQLAEDLGPDFDVVHEGIGKDWEHVHAEFDPKGPA